MIVIRSNDFLRPDGRTVTLAQGGPTGGTLRVIFDRLHAPTKTLGLPLEAEDLDRSNRSPIQGPPRIHAGYGYLGEFSRRPMVEDDPFRIRPAQVAP
jgi:hypothetical protein